MVNFTTVGPVGGNTQSISRSVKKRSERYVTSLSSTGKKKKTHSSERRHINDRRRLNANNIIMDRRYNSRRRTNIDLSV